MRDPRIGILSISEVRISRDLSYADVYVSMLEAESAEDRETLLAVLDNASGYLRSLLAARSKLRVTPQLRFHYVEMLERGAELERLIDDAVAQDQARKQGAAQPGARQLEEEE
jgi:ribosome-binding factor A